VFTHVFSILLNVLRIGSQWLQFDIGPPSLVTGVITRGRGDSSKRQWVTRYQLAYSNHSNTDSKWIFYNDASHLDPKVCGFFAHRTISEIAYGL